MNFVIINKSTLFSEDINTLLKGKIICCFKGDNWTITSLLWLPEVNHTNGHWSGIISNVNDIAYQNFHIRSDQCECVSSKRYAIELTIHTKPHLYDEDYRIWEPGSEKPIALMTKSIAKVLLQAVPVARRMLGIFSTTSSTGYCCGFQGLTSTELLGSNRGHLNGPQWVTCLESVHCCKQDGRARTFLLYIVYVLSNIYIIVEAIGPF